VTTQKIDWHPLNKTNIRRLIGGASLSILAIRRDGDGYVELTNGDHVQNLYFAASPTVFAVIDEPPAPSYKLGERRLPLEDKSNGT
jgi:hypothetical protein